MRLAREGDTGARVVKVVGFKHEKEDGFDETFVDSNCPSEIYIGKTSHCHGSNECHVTYDVRDNLCYLWKEVWISE